MKFQRIQGDFSFPAVATISFPLSPASYSPPRLGFRIGEQGTVGLRSKEARPGGIPMSQHEPPTRNSLEQLKSFGVNLEEKSKFEGPLTLRTPFRLLYPFGVPNRRQIRY